MNLVQESFFRWLHDQTNHERLNNYIVYDGYYNGDHEIDIPPKIKASLQSQLGTVNNYCRIVVDTPVEYILAGDIGIEVKHSGSNQSDADKAERLLYEVYEYNGLLDENMIKIAAILGKKGDVFLKLYIEDKRIKISVLRPDICFPRYKSDNYTELMYCAIKWFDEDGEEKKWKAQVFRPDSVDYYELGEAIETQYSQWNLIRSDPNPLEFIPAIHIKNTSDDLEFGFSDLQVMTDLQDALNKTITDMLLTMDNQAFQRVVIFGGQSPKGHEITMEPGKITEVPNENGSLSVIQAADITPFIMALDKIVDQISAVTGIPKLMFTESKGFPMSGYALRIHSIPLERKCRKKIVILRNRLKELNNMIFRAAKYMGMGDYTDFKTDIKFNGGLPIDEVARAQVQESQIRNRIRSRRSIMEEIGVENIEAEMAQIESEIAQETKWMLDQESLRKGELTGILRAAEAAKGD